MLSHCMQERRLGCTDTSIAVFLSLDIVVAHAPCMRRPVALWHRTQCRCTAAAPLCQRAFRASRCSTHCCRNVCSVISMPIRCCIVYCICPRSASTPATLRTGARPLTSSTTTTRRCVRAGGRGCVFFGARERVWVLAHAHVCARACVLVRVTWRRGAVRDRGPVSRMATACSEEQRVCRGGKRAPQQGERGRTTCRSARPPPARPADALGV